MPAPANKAARRLLTACLTLSLAPSAFSTSAQAQEQAKGKQKLRYTYDDAGNLTGAEVH